MTDMPSDTDDIIVAGLAQGLSYAETGRLASVSAKTVQRRMADPAFSTKVDAARSAKVNEITGRLTEQSPTATKVFEEAMEPGQPMKYRLAGAGATLRHLRDLRNPADLEQRIQEVEALAGRLSAAVDLEGDG